MYSFYVLWHPEFSTPFRKENKYESNCKALWELKAFTKLIYYATKLCSSKFRNKRVKKIDLHYRSDVIKPGDTKKPLSTVIYFSDGEALIKTKFLSSTTICHSAFCRNPMYFFWLCLIVVHSDLLPFTSLCELIVRNVTLRVIWTVFSGFYIEK